ncbi:MAG: hypothetical protein ACRCYZ_02880, partial [Alphaproteobacteria bacterium]
MLINVLSLTLAPQSLPALGGFLCLSFSLAAKPSHHTRSSSMIATIYESTAYHVSNITIFRCVCHC